MALVSVLPALLCLPAMVSAFTVPPGIVCAKPSDVEPEPPTLPPEVQVLEMVLGGWKAQAIAAFVRVGLPNLMSGDEYSDPKTLAEEAELNGNAVFRLLRFLATTGICKESPEGGSFKLGPLGAVCSRSHPQSAAGRVLLEGSSVHTNLWLNMSEYLKTGSKVMKKATGYDDYWKMCEKTPDHLKVFQEAMTSYSNDEATAMKLDFLSPTLDLTGFKTVCDLGGAEGALAKALAERFPDPTYILADLQEAVDRIDQSALPPKFEVAGCDFFKKSTIPNADAYLLKHILHDWDDEKSVTILKNIKDTNPNTTVFIMEFGPMPGPNVPHISKMFDLHMAITFNAHERTQEEYNGLFEESGYKLSKAHLISGGNYPLYVQEINVV